MKPLRLRVRVALVLGMLMAAALAAGWVRAAPGAPPAPAPGMRVGPALKHDLSPPLNSLPVARGQRLPQAADFLARRRLQDRPCRFDVVSVAVGQERPRIEVFVGAFEAS